MFQGQFGNELDSDNFSFASLSIDQISGTPQGVLSLVDRTSPEHALNLNISFHHSKDSEFLVTLNASAVVNADTGEAVQPSVEGDRLQGLLKEAFFDGHAELSANRELLNLKIILAEGLSVRMGLVSWSMIDKDSELAATKTSWEEFKGWMAGLPSNTWIFRGQSQPWRLATTFHRLGRYNLLRYNIEDISLLHRRLSGLTRHYYQLSDPEQKGAFLMLLQHHGYPTPLLDWSWSPYVASFFAFREVPPYLATHSDEEIDQHVRVYCFNTVAYSEKRNQLPYLFSPKPHLGLVGAPSLENTRVIPQQALSTNSTVADIESHLRHLENGNTGTLIKAFDIPYSECGMVLKDLMFMGITAGSLFPGLDGSCEEMRLKRFPPG